VVSAMLAASMPQQIARLALLAPGGFGRVTGRRLDLRKLPEGAGASDAQRSEVLRHNLMAMMFARAETADAAAIEIQHQNVVRTRYDSRRFSLSPYTREALPRIEVPTLLIYGMRDNLAWPSIDARIGACLALKPDIQVERIADTGHWVQYEAAGEVNRRLLDFFG
jgi:pimeloyl-ACP methyl ester carboxylesterase